MQDLSHHPRGHKLAHDQVYASSSHAAERGTRIVMWSTAAMMVVEIAAGWWFNSVAPRADGWPLRGNAERHLVA